MSKKYALKGVNDDCPECSVCGKDHLKKVMWLVELGRDGEALSDPFPCGTTCGAKLMGYTHSKVSTRVKNFDSEVALQRCYMKNAHPLTIGRDKLIKDLNKLGLMGAERWEHPIMNQVAALDKQIHEDVYSKEILIAL
jgi:hypothetical protein